MGLADYYEAAGYEKLGQAGEFEIFRKIFLPLAGREYVRSGEIALDNLPVLGYDTSTV